MIHFSHDFNWQSAIPATMTALVLIESLRSTTRPTQRRALETKKFAKQNKTMNNLWSRGYSQRRCHSQRNVKLRIITSFEQYES